MKIGIKTYRFVEGLEILAEHADFIEVMALYNQDYSFFKELGLPIVIHAQHELFGINNADSQLRNKNLDAINHARKLADYLDAEQIVVHPGVIRNENCSFENSIEIFNAFNDYRIIVENMPRKNYLCYSPADSKRFLQSSRGDFCLDINHAIETTFGLKTAYSSVLNDFLALNPKHYHLGGQKINGRSHLAFEDSDIDLKQIFSILPRTSQITLETSNNLKKTFEDIQIIRRVIKDTA